MNNREIEILPIMSRTELEKWDAERDFYTEAQLLLKGLTGILPELRHLEALQEHHEVSLIRIANKLDEMKKTVLEMP